MNIYEFAMKSELEGSAYYKRAADLCKDEWLKGIFEFLSLEEKKHFNIFKEMKDRNLEFKSLENHNYKDLKSIFQDKREEKIIGSLSELQTSIYLAAAKDERDTIESYERILSEIENEQEKKAVLEIINEEKEHLRFLEEVIELMNKLEKNREQ
ncbi:ferritin family protein [Clostridium sp. JNZ J1-5]